MSTAHDGPVKGHGEFALALIAALNLPPKGIRGITIRVHANEVVIVTVERLVYKSEAPRITEILNRYNLVPADPPVVTFVPLKPPPELSAADQAVQKACE